MFFFLGCSALGVGPADHIPADLEQLGRTSYLSGDYDQADAFWQKALTLAIRQSQPAVEARIYLDVGGLEEERGRYREAMEHAEAALRLSRDLQSESLEAEALALAGLIRRRIGMFSDSLADSGRALALARRTNDHGLQSESLRNMGAIYQEKGDYQRASAYYRESLQQAAAGADHDRRAKALNNLGGLHRLQGKYREALDYYGQSLALRRDLGDLIGQGKVLGNICLVHENLNNFADAVEYCGQALEIAQKTGDRAREANNLNNMAGIYRRSGDVGEAIRFYNRSAAIKAEIGDRGGEARALNNIGEIYLLAGAHADALPYFTRSLAIKEELGLASGRSATLYNLGRVSLELGRDDEALRYLHRALAVQLGVGEIDLLWRIFDDLGRVQARLSSPPSAVFYGKQAVNTLQYVRSHIKDLEKYLRQSYLEDKTEVYRRLADLLISEGRLAEARHVIRMLKEEEYFEFIGRDAAEGGIYSQVPPAASETKQQDRLWSMRDNVVALGEEYGGLLGRYSRLDQGKKNRLEELEAELSRAQEQFLEAIRDLEAEFRRSEAERAIDYGRIDLKEVESLQETLARLGELGRKEMEGAAGSGVILVHTLSTESALHLIVTTPHAQLARSSAVSRKDLYRLIGDFLEDMENRSNDFLSKAENLYRLLIGPIEDDLAQAGPRTLMISLDGALRYLPVAALFDGEKFLVERYALAVFTPVSQDKLDKVSTDEWTVAAFGVSRPLLDFPGLKAVPAELEGIVRHGEADSDGVVAGVVYLDERFTSDALKDVLRSGRYRVIHLATHFDFKPGTDYDSALLLGDASLLDLHAIRTQQAFKFRNVDLLTLSACNTAVDSRANGTEIESLGALAQIRGAYGVMATLWRVADTGTSEFMKRFYRLRARGFSKAEALRRSQISFIQGENASDAELQARGIAIAPGDPSAASSAAGPFSHPYFWAPFILMGNWL